MHDIDEMSTDAEFPDDGHAEPAGRLLTKRSIDHEVAMLCGLPMKTVNEVTAMFLDLAMSAIAERGELYLHRFGTFTVKRYKGKALAQEQLGKKVPPARRTMRDISKNEIHFKKSRGFRSRLRDLGW